MSVVLGVDGGNTKTIALAARVDGTILGVGRAGCGDIYASTPEAAVRETTNAVEAALRDAGIGPPAIQAACFSMAGADWPEDFEYLQRLLAGFGGSITVVNDAMGALRAGTVDGIGVVVACGTGAATGAKGPDGRYWHSSFWQEPQGAYELARKAIRAVYRAELGVELPTSLTAQVLAHFGQPTVEALLMLFTTRSARRPDASAVARLARILLDEAAAGDGVAQEIVRSHGAALGDYALVAARRVGLDGTAFPLVLTGGVFRHPARMLADALVGRVPGAQPVFSQLEPVAGALLLALEAAGVQPDNLLRERIASTMPPASVFET